jgi:hypothetical protein
MHFADQRGLDQVLATLQKYAQGRHGWAFEAAPLLRDPAASASRRTQGGSHDHFARNRYRAQLSLAT